MDEVAEDESTDEWVPHEGRLKGATTYLIFNFYAGRPIDVHRVADELMRADIVETAYSAAMPEVRVSRRFRRVQSIRRRAQALSEFSSKPMRLRSVAPLLWRYPGSVDLLLPLVFTVARGRLRPTLHRLSLGLIRMEHATDVEVEELLADLQATAGDMDEVDAEIVRNVAATQVVGAINVAVDRRLLSPGYLGSEPYLRLGLRGSRHRFIQPANALRDDSQVPASTPAEEESSWTHVEAHALIHRTGVIQVVLHVPLPADMTCADSVGRATSYFDLIEASALPEPLIGPYMRAHDMRMRGNWRDEMEAGVRWREIELESPASLDDIFDMYLVALRKALPSLVPDWMCYPLLIADGVECSCSSTQWLDHHQDDLARLMLQVKNPTRYAQATLDEILTDISPVRDGLLFVNEARGVQIDLSDEGSRSWADDVATLIPIEQALLQRGQLKALEWEFARAASDPRHLESLEESIINGLQEFRSGQLRASDAQNIVDRIIQQARAETDYARLVDSVNQLHQKITASEARRSARRGNLFAFLAVIVAVVLGIPAIDYYVELAERVPKDSLFQPTAKPLLWFDSLGPSVTWSAFITLIVTAIVAWVVVFVVRAFRRRGRSFKPAGRSWDVPLELHVEDKTD